MTTTATKLLDATSLRLIRDPLRRVRTSQGDLLEIDYYEYFTSPAEQVGFVIMRPAAPFEVDGIEYDARFGRGPMGIKPAVECWTDEVDGDGCCWCVPFEYQPRSYRFGDIDEELWLRHGVVVGKGE